MSSDEPKRVSKEEILQETRREFRKNRKREGWQKEDNAYDAYRPGPLVSKKKPKKEKKKHKKHKRSKKSHKSDSNEESSHSEEECWAESDRVVSNITTTVESNVMEVDSTSSLSSLQREDWMEMPTLSAITGQATSQADIRKEKEQKKREEAKKLEQRPGEHVRELNPFWKDGGKGLPKEESAEVKPKTVVGDGGKSWLRRAYKRAVEQAAEERRSLEEVATERWGSLERIHSMLKSAGINPGSLSDGHYPKTSFTSRHQEERQHRNTGGFLKPGDDIGAQRLPKSHFAGVGSSSSRSSQHSQGWRRKAEQSHEEEEVKEYHEFVADSPGSSSDAMEVPVEEETTEPAKDIDDAPDSPTLPPVTDAELNAIGAKIMRAELMGNTGKVENLKRELEALQARKKQYSSKHQVQKSSKSHDRVVVLTKTDRLGNVRPAEFDDTSRGKSHKMRQASRSHDKKGKREKYFADDDRYTLQDLMREEMSTSAEDTQVAIAKMAGKFVRAANSDDTVDDVLDYASSSKHNPERERQKERNLAVLESKQMTEILDNCKYCFDNSRAQKHLMVAIGINVYLAAPDYESLTDGHCLLVPMQHVVCATALDENVWSEIEVFKKGLTRMFSDMDQDIVYIESYTDTKRKAHMIIECIPIPKEEGFMAPMYFKKAIMESDEEWAQNKKLVDTSKKGLRNSVPPGFPYFSVDFGISGGYAHVIEDKAKFPHYFGKEIIGGMLDAEPRLWRKPQHENFERQKEKVLQISEWWKPYDWTQQLKK